MIEVKYQLFTALRQDQISISLPQTKNPNKVMLIEVLFTPKVSTLSPTTNFRIVSLIVVFFDKELYYFSLKRKFLS